ncbi:MAG: hypothetical protein JWM34_1108 [Ilumatobacteraceae bacterium]|nr:hypothetical protein [Ilumatobacteraceae bacterium]
MTVSIALRPAKLHRVAWLSAPLAIVLLTSAVFTEAHAATAYVAGSQGVDTALPLTDSAVTVSGRGAFSNLKVTVNQTAHLTNQAVSVTWTGAAQSTPAVQGNFVQIMQCWGDDDGTHPENPGPSPEQCEQGALTGQYGLSGYPGYSQTRVISNSQWDNFDADVGYLDTRTRSVWMPFRGVDGTVIDVPTDPTFIPGAGSSNYWLNPYFNIVTTNEIGYGATDATGKGAELFQVLNSLQSSGLGCGGKTQALTDGTKRVPKCWLVAVPRAMGADENVGTPFEADAVHNGVYTSPLAPTAWQNRIAIPLDFNSVDSSCPLAANTRRISGSEMALDAIANWQPTLCANTALTPFAYAPISDSSARQQLLSGVQGAPGMAVVSQPISSDLTDPAKPLVYAPVTLSGLTIGFNVERSPHFDADADEVQLGGIRVAHINLTPRLVAKMLTQSYRQAINIIQVPAQPRLTNNATHLTVDPDFLQFNPEFAELGVGDSRTASGLQLPQGNSDAAQQLWDWILADPEAKAWLDGVPDEWGMTVNPIYSTNPSINPTGVSFADPVPNSFPKADSYCYQGEAIGNVLPPTVCGTDWMPYRQSMESAAQVARTASDGAKISENSSPLNSSDVWKTNPPQSRGARDIFALTNTPSAARFGLQTASLSQAGDDGMGRSFVAPTDASLTLGVSAMKPGAEPSMLEPSPSNAVPGAYPLTTLSYGIVSPLSLDDGARADYASFIDYAAGAGQVTGDDYGQLPRGYVPLPDSLETAATAAANSVRTMTAPVQPDESTTTTTTSTTTPETTAAPTTTTTTVSTETPPATEFTVQAEAPVPTFPSSSGNGGSSSGTRGPSGSSSSSATTVATTVLTTDTTTVGSESAISEPAVSEPITAVPATVPATTIDPADEPETTAPTVITPILKLARNRYAVPALGVVSIGSALGALEITKRPRRGSPPPTGTDSGVGPDPDTDMEPQT